MYESDTGQTEVCGGKIDWYDWNGTENWTISLLCIKDLLSHEYLSR